MSLTLDKICDRFPNWVGAPIYINQHTLRVYRSSGLPIGCLYQDKTRCIYGSYIDNDSIHTLANMKFLSYFKHKHLLTIKIDSYTRHIYVLQELLK